MKSLVLSILILVGVLFSLVSTNENPIYIWQRTWKPELLESINQIKPSSNQFMILAGDVNTNDKGVSFSKVPVNWKYLKNAGAITIDIRMRTGLAKTLKNKDLTSFSGGMKQFVMQIIKDARAAGVEFKGLQIDYDCPTSQLADFTRVVGALKNEFPNLQISITALPAWMMSKDFLPLISSTDYYVLQLHSFELPKGNDKKQYIFPKDKAMGYFHQAISFHKPFYLSLPTYGYEVAYKNGKFIGLRAEGGVQFYGKGIQRNMMSTEPKEIVAYLNSIDKIKADAFRGVCWFRLPIKSDNYNWNIKTLAHVIKRELPKGLLTLEINITPSGVKEVYLINNGEINYSEKISFDLLWNGAKPIYDVLGDFEYTDLMNIQGIHVTGKAPQVSQRKMVAWFRSSDKSNLILSNHGVSVYEKQ